MHVPLSRLRSPDRNCSSMLIIIAARGLSAAMRVIKLAPTPTKWLSLSSNFACLRAGPASCGRPGGREVLVSKTGLAARRSAPALPCARDRPRRAVSEPRLTSSASSPHPIVGGISPAPRAPSPVKSGVQRRSNRAPHFGNYWSRRAPSSVSLGGRPTPTTRQASSGGPPLRLSRDNLANTVDYHSKDLSNEMLTECPCGVGSVPV